MTWKLDQRHKPTHNSFALYYHVVFVTKKRDPMINKEIADFLCKFFEKKCEELEVHLLAQSILCDHVHMVISLRPSHYIPEVINYLKGTSSHEANNHQKFQNVLYWMPSYHIDSISKNQLDRAKGYVRDQFNHHPDKIPE